jgi:membrane protein
MNALRRFADRMDGFQQQRAWLAFPFAVVRKFGEDQAGNLAALIAYYAFFSFFPLMLALTTVLGYVLASHPQVAQQVVGSVISQFPVVGDQLKDVSHPLHGNVFALVVGLAGALWAGLGIANSAQTAMNTVWQVPIAARPNFFKRTLRSLLLVVVLGVAVLATTVISGFTSGADSYGFGAGAGIRILGIVVALGVNIVIFAAAFRVLTDKSVGTRDVLPGAIFAAVGWQALQLLGGWYIAHTIKGASNTYGTFAIVIGLLTFFYVAAQITLFGAELNVVRSQHLWPRSLMQPPGTPADREAYQGYAQTQQHQPDERIHTEFPPGRFTDSSDQRRV